MCPFVDIRINTLSIKQWSFVRQACGDRFDSRSELSAGAFPKAGYLEKPAPLAFRGTLRGLSIGGRIINQWLTLQLMMSLPPNPHPVEVFRCAQQSTAYVTADLCPFPQTPIPLRFFDVPNRPTRSLSGTSKGWFR